MAQAKHAVLLPECRIVKKAGTSGKGRFYRVDIRDKSDFVMFRNHDVGGECHVERLAGKRANGRWSTVSWLIDKNEAHVTNGILVGDNDEVKNVLKRLRRRPKHLKGDIFEAGPEVNGMEQAEMKNVKKTQEARWKK